MTAKSVKTEEHAFKKFSKDIKGSNLGGLLFFFGEEQYLVRWAVDSVLEHYIEPGFEKLNCTRLDRQSATPAAVIAQCETLPMLAEKRIVIIEDFPAGDPGSKENYTETEENELIEYMQELPDSCILILTSDVADKRRKIFKTVAALGSCYEFGRLDEHEVRKFINKRLQESGKKAEASVVRRIIERSGYFDRQSDYTLNNLDNDLKKMIAHCDGDEIRSSDADGGLSGNTETHVFDMVDAITRNDKGEAMSILHNLLSSGESWQRLLALLSSHFEIILMVKEMRDEGKNSNEIKESLGIHEYRILLAGRLSSRYSIERLRRILCGCFAVEKNHKSGFLDERLALELLIAGM